MATGSGKTDIMAAIMLYMYAELGYQNFLFVVNTNSVISKTKENLLNPASKKYLFASNMVINGQRLEIKEVATFPKNPEPGVIYLRLTTIQTLSNELGEGRENSLTYEDLAKQKMVILADEAHHFSADTKSGATPTEAKNSRAWESVLDRIRQGNAENRQFEFTATIDLQNESIRNKYASKILYQYDLTSFVEGGYSKRVRYLQANADDKQKMLNAILLSQYRKHVAKEDWDSLSKYGIKIADIPKVDISQGVSESERVDESFKVETELATLELSYDNNVLLKKAIARNPFFRFNNLKGHLPNLKSMREFLDDANWLGAIPELNIALSKGQELTRERELQAVEKYLEYIQRAILMNYKKQRGTNKFVSVPVSEMVVDYEKRVATTSRKEISEVIMPHDAKKMDWFPHDKAVVDNLEWNLIEEVIQPHIAKLREEHEDVYLIRNDERLTQFALHDFGQNIQSYTGFMPDFILYLGSSNEIIQVYIEPKGQAFVYKDQWKEDLLTKIKQADIIVEDENVRLYGVKFYTGDNGREILNELDTLRSNGRSELVKSIEEEFENLL